MLINDVFCAPFQEFLPMLDDNSIKLCFTSPPYEDQITYRGKSKEIVSTGLVGEEFIQTYWIDLFDSLLPKVRDDAMVGVVINDKQRNRFKLRTNYIGMNAVCERGWGLVEHIPWIKTAGIPRSGKMFQDWWEHIYLFAKTPEYTWYPDRIRGKYAENSVKRYSFGDGRVKKLGNTSNRSHSRGEKIMSMFEDSKDEHHTYVKIDVVKGKLLPNVLIVSPDTGRSNLHPARFPFTLARWAITLCTDTEDIVLDPMCGSGTVPIKAKQMGRNFIGSDIGEDFITYVREELDKTYYQEDFTEQEDSMIVECTGEQLEMEI